ncbi:hypothetical protein ENUP19_0332G0008 [Entamoeba nuttalli]|uniref:Uncharacterized protein n=1 Tax=Entamoeba nuttalli TaxID=412467 RepID=A0ABQ0DWT1_9EUKA
MTHLYCQRYFTITRENAIADFKTYKWIINLPWEFITSENYPKTIEVMNFVYFNLNVQLDIGVSCHASFNYDSPENDQMICFSTYGNMTPKHFDINKNITRIEIWFKDYKGKSIFPVGLWDEYFNLELNLHY